MRPFCFATALDSCFYFAVEMVMRTRIIAAVELVLLLPAALFMAALVVRMLQPLRYEPAHTAHQLVMWYAGRMWTLWILLLLLPFTVLVTGSATLLATWGPHTELPTTGRKSMGMIRAHLATVFVAATTAIAGGILVIVVLHMLAN